MLLCDVALGTAGGWVPGQRRAQAGCHNADGGFYHTIYNNDQAYPTYIIHYK